MLISHRGIGGKLHEQIRGAGVLALSRHWKGGNKAEHRVTAIDLHIRITNYDEYTRLNFWRPGAWFSTGMYVCIGQYYLYLLNTILKVLHVDHDQCV